jgi:hypothetical protein
LTRRRWRSNTAGDLDRDAFRLDQSKRMNVIVSKELSMPLPERCLPLFGSML